MRTEPQPESRRCKTGAMGSSPALARSGGQAATDTRRSRHEQVTAQDLKMISKRMDGSSRVLTSPHLAWAALTAYAVLLTYLLLAPHPLGIFGSGGDTAEQTIDRTITGCLQHGLAYALLAWLFVWASSAALFRRSVASGTPAGKRSRASTSVGQKGASGASQLAGSSLAVGHGLVTEWLQCFIPHRYADWADAAADALGFALGWLSGALVLRILGKTSAKAARPFARTETAVFK
jgi:hypothetical protein